MKIIQIIPALGFGGAEIMFENLAYKLKEKGHAVTCVCISGTRTEIAKRLEQTGIRMLYLNKKRGFKPSYICKLMKLFRTEKPDVIHTHLHCTIYAFPAAVLTHVRGKIHTLHSVAEAECATARRIINGIFFRHFGVVPVALSKRVQATIVDTYRISAKQIPIIYNGIDISRCKIKEDVKLHNPIRLIHVGRFAYAKNHENIIKAFQLIHESYPNSELFLLGDGELKDKIMKETEQNNLLPFVRFVGTTTDVMDYLHHSDIFLLPSVYEGMPITIIEAMGTGIPIVASPVGGVSDMLRNRESAIFCDVTPETIYRAVSELIQSEALRKRLSKHESERVKDFTSEEMANRYIALYQSLVTDARGEK